MFSRAQTLSYRAAENSSFLVPEILSMDRELLEQYMAADNEMCIRDSNHIGL